MEEGKEREQLILVMAPSGGGEQLQYSKYPILP